MLEELRNKLRALLDQRAAAMADLDTLVEAAETRDDKTLTEDEETQLGEIRAKVKTIDGETAGLSDRIAGLEADAEARAKAAKLAEQVGAPTKTPEVRVIREEAVYRPDSPVSFFADAYAVRTAQDPKAAGRLARHSEMETRAVGTAAVGGLVVPQYLVEEFAEILHNSRAFINAIRQEPLTAEGQVLVVPRAQTGVSVAAQATENTAVSETNIDYDNDLSISVRTYAGQQDVSRQSLERGTPGIDRLIYQDLVEEYGQVVDAACLNGAGTSGTHLGVLNATGINAVTYTDATPTVAEAWPKIADAVQQVATNRKKAAANLVVMHPRRWGWFIASLDTTNRPLVINDAGAAQNAMGTAAAAFGEGQLVGTIQGLPVLVDANVPTSLGTNEDAILVLNRRDPIIWEQDGGMPRELRFDETAGGNLTVKLVVYGYSAFTAERQPTGVAAVTGTGLIAPTF